MKWLATFNRQKVFVFHSEKQNLLAVYLTHFFTSSVYQSETIFFLETQFQSKSSELLKKASGESKFKWTLNGLKSRKQVEPTFQLKTSSSFNLLISHAHRVNNQEFFEVTKKPDTFSKQTNQSDEHVWPEKSGGKSEPGEFRIIHVFNWLYSTEWAWSLCIFVRFDIFQKNVDTMNVNNFEKAENKMGINTKNIV